MKNKVKTQKAKNKSAQAGKNEGYQWNLSLLYASANDPQIEKDVVSFEGMVDSFSKKYDTEAKDFLTDNAILFEALKMYEDISANTALKALLYFFYSKEMNASNTDAVARLALLENRLTVALNKTTFFIVDLSKIPLKRQTEVLSDNRFSHFRVFLQRIFDDAKHILTTSEEKILGLKSLPSYSMWVSANEKILNMKTVAWKGNKISVQTALQTIQTLSTQAERAKLAKATYETLRSSAPFAEAELNAIYTDKKINDELRGFKTPYEATVLEYRNNPKVIDALRKVVMDNVQIAHDFYRLKARLLGHKKLLFSDNRTSIGKVKTVYTFDDTIEKLKQTFGALNPKFKAIIETYVKNGQLDVYPRVGKAGGAYCSSSYANPTYILLNHTNDLRSFSTCAHELGHGFHGEFSEAQGPIYSNYSIALAETASTLFEGIAFQAIFDSLPDSEKVVALHDRISEDIYGIFRQVACFNFELDLHTAVRTKGYISKEEIAGIHNKNIFAYLGPVFDLKEDDGYMFVMWTHIRRFFYVYTYAYGMLVSKALLRRYKKDPSFWKKIEQLLAAGGNDSPENILKAIGIDVSSPDFWKEGLLEIADDIKELERLTKKAK
ncbi:MAG TPA: M3 family metallopeptidase [Candidatus Paceibacterota bacterium]|jgi:oligoendopeptidase F|nr:M3 family metallopeptidase [Candidatus Paceibacterota bacterium]